MSKLTREQKIEIYKRRKQGENLKSLSKEYSVLKGNIYYMIKQDLSNVFFKKIKKFKIKNVQEFTSGKGCVMIKRSVKKITVSINMEKSNERTL